MATRPGRAARRDAAARGLELRLAPWHFATTATACEALLLAYLRQRADRDDAERCGLTVLRDGRPFTWRELGAGIFGLYGEKPIRQALDALTARGFAEVYEWAGIRLLRVDTQAIDAARDALATPTAAAAVGA